MILVAIYQPVDDVQGTAIGALRGFKDTKVPLVIVLIGCWAIGFLGAAVGSLLLDLGPHGVWAGLTAGLCATGLMMVLRVRRFLAVPLSKTDALTGSEQP